MAKKATSAPKAAAPKGPSVTVPSADLAPAPRLEQGMSSSSSAPVSFLPEQETPLEVFDGVFPPEAPLSIVTPNPHENGASADAVVADQVPQGSDSLKQPQSEDDVPPAEVQASAEGSADTLVRKEGIEIVMPGNYQTGHGRPVDAHKGPPRYYTPPPPKLF